MTKERDMTSSQAKRRAIEALRWEKITAYGSYAERYAADTSNGRYTVKRNKRSCKWVAGFNGIDWPNVFETCAGAKAFCEGRR